MLAQIRKSNLVKSLAASASAQIMIQGLGFASGLMVVRLLAPDQYALYTIANAMLGALTVLADSGISKGAMAQGGRVWGDSAKLGRVMVTTAKLRRQFASVSILLALPVIWTLLVHHGASWRDAMLIVVAISLSFSIALGTAIYQVVGQLHQKIGAMASINMQASGLRIVALAVSITFIPYAYAALFAGCVPQLLANRRLRKLSSHFADWTQSEDKGTREETLRLVKRILPGSVFYCVSGQLSIFLISIFGATVAVAQVGALGRLSQVMTLVSAVVATVIVPRFARINNPRRLLRLFASSLASVAVFCGLLVGLVIAFGNEALWLLGRNYEGLSHELTLAISGSAIALLGGAAYALGAARGWVASPLISIGGTLAVQVALICTMDLSTAAGVLSFSLIVSSVPLAIHTVYNLLRCLQEARP
jgi:O-antigen/teichoic acid export membrane protein